MKNPVMVILIFCISSGVLANWQVHEHMDCIEEELRILNTSPGERMLNKALQYHPVVATIRWISTEMN